MDSLQERVKAFLKRAVPDDMDYVPDSLAERFLIQYAEDGHLTLDKELAEILSIIVQDADTNVPAVTSPSEQEYLGASSQLLAEILAQEMKRPSWPGIASSVNHLRRKPWWKFW